MCLSKHYGNSNYDQSLLAIIFALWSDGMVMANRYIFEVATVTSVMFFKVYVLKAKAVRDG